MDVKYFNCNMDLCKPHVNTENFRIITNNLLSIQIDLRLFKYSNTNQAMHIYACFVHRRFRLVNAGKISVVENPQTYTHAYIIYTKYIGM